MTARPKWASGPLALLAIAASALAMPSVGGAGVARARQRDASLGLVGVRPDGRIAGYDSRNGGRRVGVGNAAHRRAAAKRRNRARNRRAHR